MWINRTKRQKTGWVTVNDLSRRALLLGGMSILAACSAGGPRFLEYRGPQVTGIVANKGTRQLQLMHNSTVLASFHFEMGFAPYGHKRFEGDGRTPEGLYSINRRNPQSEYHLSLGISYPNTEDYAQAVAQGRSPGGDIFIHGTPRSVLGQPDWTVGCIAVTNDEVELIYAMVEDGTPILIVPADQAQAA